jgi:FkbM family methyltransferase
MKAALKALAQRILNRFGYEVRRKAPSSKAPPLELLSLVVRDWIATKAQRSDRDFSFVQIGAHDGLHSDPLRPFILQHHWRGILIEPQPKIFERLLENYRTEPQLTFENAAIAGRDGTAKLYTLRVGPGLANLTMAASFDRAALERIGHDYRTEVEELVVPVLTVESLLAKHGVRLLDLVQVDAEGYDDQIVAMFARSNVLPAIFHFETGSLSSGRLRVCLDLLADLGYRVATVGLDTIAYRDAEMPPGERADRSIVG